jgi:hypothetical protein
LEVSEGVNIMGIQNINTVVYITVIVMGLAFRKLIGLYSEKTKLRREEMFQQSRRNREKALPALHVIWSDLTIGQILPNLTCVPSYPIGPGTASPSQARLFQ